MVQYPDLSYRVAKDQSLLGEFLALGTAEIGLRIKETTSARLKNDRRNFDRPPSGDSRLADVNTNLGEGKPEFRMSVTRTPSASTPASRRPISAVFWSTRSTAGSPPVQ